MPDVSVAVPFVEQETLFYCGPATLEMLLRTVGVVAPATPPSWQDQLWAEVQAKTGAVRPSGAPSTPTAPAFPTQKCELCSGWKCWSTTPEVLELLANAKQAVAHFTMSANTTEQSATGELMDTIDAKLPAVALIRGWQHWVAVDGYRHGEPGAVAVAGRNLNGMFIRDPWEDAAVHYITWSDWKSEYLDFIPCGDHQNTMLVMSGVKLAPKAPQEPPKPPVNVRILDPQKLRLKFVKKILPKAEAIARAKEAREELAGSSLMRAGFAETKAARALLVQRLDNRDRYYYIVTFTAGGRDTARVIVDAHDGHYSEVSTIRKKGQFLRRHPAARVGRERLEATGKSPTPAARYQLRAGVVGVHPVPVWKPCGQSLSPFLPFWQYSVGDSFVYYRFDGRRFDELTEGPA